MEKKLIFLDIDGTILESPDQGIHDAVKEGLERAREKGHQIFICTGRSRSVLPEFLGTLTLDGTICSAGSDIWIHGENIFRTSQEASVIRKTCETFEKLDAVYMLEGFEHTYVSSRMEDVTAGDGTMSGENPELARWKNFLRKRKNARKIEDWDPQAAPIPKMTFILYHKEDIETVKEALKDDFYVVFFEPNAAGLYNGELISKTANKGTAIHRTAEYLGVDVKDTIAFGDSMNDYQMIEYAGLGIVMENGDEELKKIADRVCESVHDDGVVRELGRMGMI